MNVISSHRQRAYVLASCPCLFSNSPSDCLPLITRQVHRPLQLKLPVGALQLLIHCPDDSILHIPTFIPLQPRPILSPGEHISERLRHDTPSFGSRFRRGSLILRTAFVLYLAELQAEAVEFLLAFVVLVVGVSQVFAERVPV